MNDINQQPEKRIRITTAKEAKDHIGKKVFWDDISSRYIFIRCGIVDHVSGKNICIDGNWLWRSDLKNLRNYYE